MASLAQLIYYCWSVPISKKLNFHFYRTLKNHKKSALILCIIYLFYKELCFYSLLIIYLILSTQHWILEISGKNVPKATSLHPHHLFTSTQEPYAHDKDFPKWRRIGPSQKFWRILRTSCLTLFSKILECIVPQQWNVSDTDSGVQNYRNDYFIDWI